MCGVGNDGMAFIEKEVANVGRHDGMACNISMVGPHHTHRQVREEHVVLRAHAEGAADGGHVLSVDACVC